MYATPLFVSAATLCSGAPHFICPHPYHTCSLVKNLPLEAREAIAACKLDVAKLESKQLYWNVGFAMCTCACLSECVRAHVYE
jgi:hypothetical protein